MNAYKYLIIIKTEQVINSSDQSKFLSGLLTGQRIKKLNLNLSNDYKSGLDLDQKLVL